MSDKRSLLANTDGSDDDNDNNNNNNSNHNSNNNHTAASSESSGELPVPVRTDRAVAGAANGASNGTEDRFTLSELMAREGGNVRDADARAMASMRQEREKAQYEEETLEEHADMVLTIMKPVSLTMLIVIVLVKCINVPKLGVSPGQVLFYQERTSASDQSQQITGALITGAIVLGGVLLATTAFILLYKYRCLKIIYGWLLTAAGLLLAAFGGLVFYLFIRTTNWPFDWISFGYLLWNFAVCGLVAIFWYAPPKLQQAYLVIISVLMAAVLTQLPEWSTWVVLAIISVYDLFAVLCPKGPLKVLLDTAVERNEHIPALLYSAAVWIFMVRNTAHDAIDDDHNDARPPKPASRLVVDQDALDIEAVPAPVLRPQHQQQHQQQQQHHHHHQQQQQQHQQQHHRASGYDAPEAMDAPARPANNPNELPAPERRKGIQLGLGDFVFYSVLVGRAALSDMSTVYTCFVAIITGLFLTLLLLDVFKRALPALPISIALGILFYFLTYIFVLPFIVELNRAGVFV